MVQIKDTVDFVLTLKRIRKALTKAGRPEAKEARRLRKKFQNLCTHAKANMKDSYPVGKCPSCLKRLPKRSKLKSK